VKAPDAMLKLGFSLLELNQKKEGCTALGPSEPIPRRAQAHASSGHPSVYAEAKWLLPDSPRRPPLSGEAFAATAEPLLGRAPFAIAVSGGADFRGAACALPPTGDATRVSARRW
jgi:hypothetical protein